MGIFDRIQGVLETRREAAKVRAAQSEKLRQQEAAKKEEERKRRLAEEERQRAIKEQERIDAAVARMEGTLALFEDPSNQASIEVSAFFAIFDKPERLKAPYLDRFAGTQQGLQTHNAGAAVGSIIGTTMTAGRRVSLEIGMERFEIARYVYDLSPQDVAMLKIVNTLHAMGQVNDPVFNSVSCAVLFNGGDCILRPSRNPKTRVRYEVTNVEEQACRACLHDNMASAKAAFDPVFQVAVQGWRTAVANNEANDLTQALIGDPLNVIMGR